MSHSINKIYMDHNSTTPVDPRVVEAMLPYFSNIFGNADVIVPLFKGDKVPFSYISFDQNKQIGINMLMVRYYNAIMYNSSVLSISRKNGLLFNYAGHPTTHSGWFREL